MTIEDSDLRVISTKNPVSGALSITVEHLPSGFVESRRGFSRDRIIETLTRRLAHRIHELGEEATACASSGPQPSA